ncbi:helix-turn-helix domain-containing protein [Gordonia sp. HY002]|uniref:PucR family transcriptional regulator n=1 Tax=Gordonia zhenghanii TaxID=2911516 RepID=UPI001EF13F5C|nr:PucR family transcriptional regulator [Gordonia zhenghanii]MCF8570555.1 helix-turn-helix domain-containing protein [Gordonia zhenghanii]MCF8607336.1 helix-turn-helix domain-containing protein [Gordonia zhenghanii]
MAETEVMSLREVVDSLDTAVDWAVLGEAADVRVADVSMIDADDIAARADTTTDLVILVGVDADGVREWLATRSGDGPRAILTKAFVGPAQAEPVVDESGVAVVGVHARARWDRIVGIVQADLHRGRESVAQDGGPDAPVDVDLVGLVALVARGTGGLVSIEDATSARVLAYSPSNGEADDLRVQTILGREGPPTYLALLRKWGVFDAIRRGGEVVDVPADDDHAMRRRLVIGVHSGTGRHLGSIWVQEGATGLAADSADVLTGAASVASRILTRAIQAPSAEAQLLQRLFGEHGGVDASSAGAYLGWAVDERAAVIGVASEGGAAARSAIGAVGGALRLHASAYAASALTTVIDDRAYIVLPAADVAPVTRWVGTLVARFDGDPALDGARLHATVVFPVDGLAEVSRARSEVDRVFAATGSGRVDRVTTLAKARTAVLMGEILDAVAGRADLVDPRVTAMVEYDTDRAAHLEESVRAYLDAHGNVRDAANRIGVHPNTLRYRIDRARQVSGLNLDDPAERLLTSLQLAMLDRRRSTAG